MAKQEMEHKRKAIHCSSSIENWKEKLKARTKLPEWNMFHLYDDVIFFGLYHIGDYMKYYLHQGRKTVFWCGSDILALTRPHADMIASIRARHFCENEVEQDALLRWGIVSTIAPMIFDDPSKYQITYQHSTTPRVFATYHKGSEKEYGYFEHPQLDWFHDLSEEEFNEKIKNYQGCIRPSVFDGFAESLAKSVLMGQYQLTTIPYPGMDSKMDFKKWLKKLSYKRKPNPLAEEWRNRLEESLKLILS